MHKSWEVIVVVVVAGCVAGLTWFPEGHVVPFLKVGRPQARRLAHPHAHRAAEHGAADQLEHSESPTPRRSAALSLPLR